MYKSKYEKYKAKYRKLQLHLQLQVGGSTSTLQKYYNELIDLYNNYQPIKPVPTIITYDDIFVGPFLLDEIKQTLNTQTLTCNKYNKLTFVTDNIDSNIIPLLIKRSLILSQFLNINKDFIVVYLDSNYTKELPKSNEIIDKENVNSGYSTNYYTVVYRREEAKKVLLHELLHQFEVDCGYTCYKQSQNHSFSYYKNKKNKNNILYNEALVETLATILNCMMTSIESNKDYIACINTEKVFIAKQVKQIMEHLNITKITDKIIANAAILEYYVMKAVILHNLDDFIVFLTNNNNSLFVYDRTQDKNKLYDKIMEYMHNVDWLQDINPSTNNSMRMTII